VQVQVQVQVGVRRQPRTRARWRLFARGSWPEAVHIADVLRVETIGAALLIIAALAAMARANSPWAETYEAVRDTRVGPEALHLMWSGLSR
jgi:NhaA family Na+:H+ antiporter